MAEQRYTETCPCGSRFEVVASGWGLREFDMSEPLGEWRQLHGPHIAAAHRPRRNGPTPEQMAAFTEATGRVHTRG